MDHIIFFLLMSSNPGRHQESRDPGPGKSWLRGEILGGWNFGIYFYSIDIIESKDSGNEDFTKSFKNNKLEAWKGSSLWFMRNFEILWNDGNVATVTEPNSNNVKRRKNALDQEIRPSSSIWPTGLTVQQNTSFLQEIYSKLKIS